jgi:hypothetical protein
MCLTVWMLVASRGTLDLVLPPGCCEAQMDQLACSHGVLAFEAKFWAGSAQERLFLTCALQLAVLTFWST